MNTTAQQEALHIAHQLVDAGVPVFVAPPRIGADGQQDWKRSGGYALPVGWENTRPDHALVDTWQPGMALCAVMGYMLDGLDIDTHKGGMDSLTELAKRGALPTPYAIADTPSGGKHLLIAPTGQRSRDGFMQGLDLKAGTAQGGHGFLFIAPTVKPSKVTGELAAYHWDQVDAAALLDIAPSGDTAMLSAVVDEARAPKLAAPAPDAPPADPERMRAYCSAIVEGIRADLNAAAEWEDGHTDGAGRGWEKLTADAAWRIASVGVTPGSGVDLAEAEGLYLSMVPPVMAETDIYSANEKWQQQARRAEPLQLPLDAFAAMGLHTPTVMAEPVADGVDAPTMPPLLPGLPGEFDPPALSESGLSLAAMAVSGVAHRYARDECSWYTRDDAKGLWTRQAASPLDWARHIVHRLAEVAPKGDKNAEEHTVLFKQAKRRGMLHTSSVRGNIAKLMMDAAPDSGLEAGSLDADPRVLWAGGWCWDLSASRDKLQLAQMDLLAPHAHSAAVLPRDIETPRWDALVSAMFPTAQLRDYFYGVMGAATTGTSGRILGVLYGKTGMAKTSLLELASLVLGTYAAQLDPGLLDARTTNEFKVMDLKGVRLGWVDEGPSDNRQGQERLKALTGGGSMRGAHKGKPSVQFRPTHTLFFTDNKEPDVSDPALLDRVRGMPISGDASAIAKAVGAIRDNEDAWLQVEGPGVLAKFIHAAGRFLGDRAAADMPPELRDKLLALSIEQDPILSWLDDRTEPTGDTGASELYADFRTHSEAHGVPRSLIPNATVWGRRLSELGYPARKTMGLKVRPLVLRRWTLGPGMTVPSTPEALGTVQGEAAKLSATVPNGPSLSLFRDSSEPVDNSVDKVGTVNCPSQGGLSPTNTPSQTQIRDTRDTRDSSVSLSQRTGKGGVEGQGASGRAPAHDAPAHVQARESKAPAPVNATPGGKKLTAKERAAIYEPIPLPSLMQRGGDPFPVALPDAGQMLATLAQASLSLDVETSGYPVGHDNYVMRTIQLGTRNWVVNLDATDPDHLQLAVHTLDAAAEIRAHSATADVSLVALGAGVDSGPWWSKTTDTAVLAALDDPAKTGLHDNPKALALKQLSTRLLDAPLAPDADRARSKLFTSSKWLTNPEPTTELERNGWAQVPSDHPVMVKYAGCDVLDTDELTTKLAMPAPGLLQRERELQRIMARLPERGLRLDADRVAELTKLHEGLRDEAAGWLNDDHGVDTPGSNVQVGQAMEALGAQLPKTKTGQASTAAEVVDQIAETEGPAQQLALDLLTYREHEKVLSTYLVPFGLQCSHGDGRARPTILTLGAAATGRMSSARPNIQQVPKAGGMRQMFVADEGMAFIAADFSSVEVRIAAAVTADATLAQMVRNGVDLHAEITKLAWGLSPEDEGFKDARGDTKGTVFGYLYGAGMTRLTKQLGSHGDKAQAVVDALKALTPQLMEYDKGLRRAVQTRMLTCWTHPSGRVGYFNADQPHKSLNMIVQGYGRELLVDAVLRWEAMHPGCTIIPIHDELVIQAPIEHAHQWALDLGECMTTTVGQGDSQVPIVAEVDPPALAWGGPAI